MANNTGWIGGRGQGLTYGAAFNTADLASLASGSAVMSSVADIANGSTNFDIFADIAFELAIASTTLAAGATCVLAVYDKFSIDGSNSYYGDNAYSSGSQKAYLPLYCWGGGGLYTCTPTITGSAQTLVTGEFTMVRIPPRAFRFVFGQILGVTLGSGTQYSQYETYNTQLNGS